MDWGIEKKKIFAALFGQITYIFHHSNNKSEIKRINNGLWTKLGSQHKRNSAILITGGLTPWDIIKSELLLIHNPFALAPLPLSPLNQLTYYKDKNNKLVESKGRKPFKILNLPTAWPDLT